jgi:hypothetical protein
LIVQATPLHLSKYALNVMVWKTVIQK